jgi:signal transduction histidine kinase
MAVGTAPDAIDHAPLRASLLRRVSLGIAGLVALVAVWTIIDPSIEEGLGPLAVILGNATAGVLMVRGGRTLPRAEGRAWILVGLGMVVAAVGVLTVGIINEMTGNAAAFGPTDLIFITTYIAVIAGLAMLPHVRGTAVQRLRVWLDGLIGAVSLGTILWVTLLAAPLGALADAPTWERIAGTAYPIIDVACVIVIMIVAVRRGSLRFDPRLLFAGVGFALQALADLDFLRSGIGRTFNEASPDFTLYLGASLCYVITGLLVRRRPEPREYADRRAALLPMIAPYGAAAVLVILLFTRVVGTEVDTLTVELLIATLIVGALVVGRQAVAIRENRILVEKERAALVSSISHELRTPLTAMMGFLDLLDHEADAIEEVERAELTGIVYSQAVYMSRIVADLIMLARGNASEIDLTEEPVAIRSAIDSAMSAVANASDATDVSCAADLVVYADGDRLQQVLVNLLANAIRYGGDYRAIVARVERDNVVLEVHDNGPGVPPRFALTIWERFERGPNRYNAANPGSGIGLAVVEAVAKAHGGGAEYERSTLLGGACFRIKLPRSRLVETLPAPTTAEDTTAA